MSRIASLIALGSLVGCAAAHGTPSPTALEVDAEISSATLGDECASAEPGRFGDCAESGCGCVQSAVRLSIVSHDGDAAVPFEVVSINLQALDQPTASLVTAQAPQIFSSDGTMVSWDEMVHPSSSLQVTYPTSAPNWTEIGNGDPNATYGMRFRVVLTVRIDGIERVLSIEPVTREAQIVT